METRWPPIKARGCAGSALGDPSTVTIEVAKGIATSGKAALAENASMPAIATAPPVAPARIAMNLVLSHMRAETTCRAADVTHAWNANAHQMGAFLERKSAHQSARWTLSDVPAAANLRS